MKCYYCRHEARAHREGSPCPTCGCGMYTTQENAYERSRQRLMRTHDALGALIASAKAVDENPSVGNLARLHEALALMDSAVGLKP